MTHSETLQAKPLRILNYGGGIQSTALLVMACNGLMGVQFDHAIFADTGDEPKEVYATVERARAECERAGIGFHVVRQGNLLEDMERSKRNLIPVYVKAKGGKGAPSRRNCTADYKIKPIRRKIKELLGLTPNQRWPKTLAVVQLFGISTDEVGRTRVSLEPFCKFEYPLIQRMMHREQCAALLRDEGWENVSRSACVYCPFHRAVEWRKVWPEYRDKIMRAEAISKLDKGFREEPFLHRSLRPIEEVLNNLPDDDNEFFGMQEECLGHCGV